MAPKTERSGYALIDFGSGRKLERFGQFLLDRSSPAADGFVSRQPDAWRFADIRIDDAGKITHGMPPQAPWHVNVEDLRFALQITPFGHVGIFPEQQANWNWLQSQCKLANFPSQDRQALNLFAYTGGATMSLAKAGFHVVHVDASTPAVRWARENAVLNGLATSPIRWIVEDARKFVAREIKRQRCYDLIVLDPPSFGHGPSGLRWEIEDDLFPLLESCLQLLRPRDSAMLLTGHSESPSIPELISWICQETNSKGEITAKRLTLIDAGQRPLDCGYSLLWRQ